MARRIANQYTPDRVSPPGDTLQETLEALGLSQIDLARRIGRTTKNVNQVVKGKAPILAAMAIQLERVLGVPADFWLAREQHYRESLARATADEELEEETNWPARFPLKEMIGLGWIKAAATVGQLKELLRFFGIASPDRFDEVCSATGVAFRLSPAFKADPYALAAWLRRGETEAQGIECAPFDGAAFQLALEQVRTLTAKLGPNFVDDVQALCAKAGVAVVVVPELPKCRTSGATRWLSPRKAMLQLSLRYKRDDRFWFSFFHEAGHIVRHGRKLVFIDDGSRGDNALEEEADAFARDLLIPPADYRRFRAEARFDEPSIQRFARSLRIAPGIVVGRLQHDEVLEWSWGNRLVQKLEWTDS